MKTAQLISLLQNLDPAGTKDVKFVNKATPIKTGEEVDIVGGTGGATDIKLSNT